MKHIFFGMGFLFFLKISAQVTLPYIEDFESLTDTIYSPDPSSIKDLANWTYSATYHTGRLRISDSGLNSKSATIYRSRFGTETENNLTLTLDLSNLTVTEDDLLLDFMFSCNASSYPNNKVFVRGSEQEEWLILYDWFTNQLGVNRWTSVFTIPVSDTLKSHGQNFSDTFQIRFGEASYLDYTGLSIDNIKLYNRPESDIAAISIIAPEMSTQLSNSETIAVEVLNKGQNTLSSIPLTIWSEGPMGREEVTEVVPSSIGKGLSETYSFSHKFDFSAYGNYKITVICGSPVDEIRENDTLRLLTGKIEPFEGDLPYYVNFENSPDTIIHPFTARIEGLSGLSFVSSDPTGALIIDSIGGGTAKLTRLENSIDYVENNLILTMDLSSMDTTRNDLLMDIRYFFYYSTGYSNKERNKLYVRGGEGFPWLVINSWGSAVEETWINLQAMSISDALRKGKQNYSSNFQIKIQEVRIKNLSNEALIIDKIKVYERFENDIRATHLIHPQPSTQLTDQEQLSVEFSNFGFANEVTVPFTVWVDGPLGRQEVIEEVHIETKTDSLVSFQFSQLFDFSERGNYNITIFRTQLDEDFGTNDTIHFVTGKNAIYTGPLPYIQDFETATDSTYAPNQALIDGLEGISYYATKSTGRFKVHDDPITLSKVVLLTTGELTYAGGWEGNQLQITMDLSEFKQEENDLYLDFEYNSSYGTSNTVHNEVAVRGSEFGEWHKLSGYRMLNNWGKIDSLNISETLRTFGDRFTSSFQIRFTSLNNSTFNRAIDNIKIYEAVSSKARSGAIAFTIGNDSYLGLGKNSLKTFGDFWAANNFNSFSIAKSNFPGAPRSSAVSFVIDTLGYVGLGTDEAGNYLSDFYKYDPGTDTWTQIADFGGGPRTNAVAFSIGEFGYVGTGLNAEDEQADFWKYDPVEDTWIEFPDWGKDKRQGAFAFVVGNKAYVGGGYYFDSFTFQLSDIQEYDPETGAWTEKIFADGLNLAVNDAAAFSLYGNGYIAYGNQEALIKYNPYTNEVENLGDYFELRDNRKDPVAFVQGDSAFLGLGSYGFFPTEYSNEFSAYFKPNLLPTDIDLSGRSLSENAGENMLIGEFSTVDLDQPYGHTYHLLSTDDSIENDFEIIGNELYALTSFDFETKSEYSILVRTVDSREGAFEKEFTISITDSNDPPIALALSRLDVDESNEETVVVGTFEVTDEDVFDNHQYSIIDGDGSNDVDNDHFFISGSDLSVINPNFEVQSSLNVNVQVTDGGGEFYSQSFTIDVNDVNEAPTNIILDIDDITESVLIGTNVGTLSSEDEDISEQSYTYSVESDTFRVISERLATIAEFDLETDKLYTLEITTEDQGGLSFSKVFEILVTSEPLGVGSPGNFTIYPNPATDYLILKDDYASKVSLFSVKGEKLFDFPIENGFRKIDVSLLESGVYMLRLYGNEGIKDYKLIKQ